VAGALISVDRARRAVRLLGEARELGVGSEAARKHLLGGIAAEIGVAIGGAVDDRAYRIGGSQGCARVTLTGFDPQTFDVYYAHHREGSAVNPVHRAIISLRAQGAAPEAVCATSSELVDRRTWERAPWVAEIVRPARVEHFLTAVRFVASDAVQGFGFMRAANDPPFSDDDRAFVHLVRSECTLFGDEPALAARARETLGWLLRGASDKEIAFEMRLSVHTVHQYVKTVFRAYGVSSRAQLFARHRAL
jgi:DNA-binding CsgD family transcriptional regulator